MTTPDTASTAELRAATARAAFSDLCGELAALRTRPSGTSGGPNTELVMAPTNDGLTGLPQLDVPMGAITFTRAGARKPVVGMVCFGMTQTALLQALSVFMAEHHRTPVLRPVFLLGDLSLLPLLGRYGFAYHVCEEQADLASDFAYLAKRYGMRQARHLSDGAVVWNDGDVIDA